MDYITLILAFSTGILSGSLISIYYLKNNLANNMFGDLDKKSDGSEPDFEDAMNQAMDMMVVDKKEEDKE